MADERRRYLAQQAELGGDEIILGTAATPARAAPALRAEPTPEPAPVAVPRVEAPPISAPKPASQPVPELAPVPMAVSGVEDDVIAKKPEGAEPKWLKGAPPIPGPGIDTTSPPLEILDPSLQKLKTLDAVAERIRSTYCCNLCPQRTNAVPGEGNPRAQLLVIGEGPGATEDATGRPFVGQAGQLLDGILQAIDLPRERVFITNIVKCRPPQNRKPQPDEAAACMPYLYRQMELIRPKVILAMGGTAGESLLGVKKSLGELRGKVHTYNGIPLVVTYHPAALLRNPNWKKPTWDDVRIARQLLDR